MRLSDRVGTLTYGSGKTCEITMGDVLGIYSLWLSGRLSNSASEIEYMRLHNMRQLSAYSY